MQRIRTANKTQRIFSDRLAIVVAIAAVALLAACDFHKKREYKGEPPPATDTTAKSDSAVSGAQAAKPSDTKPPAETPPPEPPPETPPEAPEDDAATALTMPEGDGCDAVGVKAAQLQAAQIGDNIPPEQMAQFNAMLVQASDEIQRRCMAQSWDDAKRKCVLESTTMQGFSACVLPKPEDHPECAAAADNFIAIRLAQLPEEQRAQVQQTLPDQRLQIVSACVEQKWTPEVIQCLTGAKAPDELQGCLQKMQPPQP